MTIKRKVMKLQVLKEYIREVIEYTKYNYHERWGEGTFCIDHAIWDSCGAVIEDDIAWRIFDYELGDDRARKIYDDFFRDHPKEHPFFMDMGEMKIKAIMYAVYDLILGYQEVFKQNERELNKTIRDFANRVGVWG